jgi:hypothetical protein
MAITNIAFEKRPKSYRKQKIEEIATGQLFVAAYHDPDDIMRRIDCNASVYVKLPKSNRCLMEAMKMSDPSPAELDAINQRRIAFNLTRGCTKAFDPNQYGYLVDSELNIFFVMEG